MSDDVLLNNVLKLYVDRSMITCQSFSYTVVLSNTGSEERKMNYWLAQSIVIRSKESIVDKYNHYTAFFKYAMPVELVTDLIENDYITLDDYVTYNMNRTRYAESVLVKDEKIPNGL